MARRYYGIDKKSKMEHIVSSVTRHQDLYKQNKAFVGYYLIACFFGLLGFGFFYLLPVSDTNIFMMGVSIGAVIPFFVLSLITGIRVMTFASKLGLKQYKLNIYSVVINVLILIALILGAFWHFAFQ